MEQVLNFYDDNDYQTQEIVNNVTLFFEEICKRLDKSRKEQDELLFSHEVEKAKAADQNDENLDKIDDELKALNHSLKFAMHHPQLETLL